ncbi:murein biosynthesis integral membrane protein MurJ [Roseimicrobium sp. ORNL1]|uniref:murein biosynthesis integral membrane protein MurJ n=1 Tax=Roseimicrobium sp. ORNL1 TaxID=2711231 RepID=UPI0013E18794|nr:murein biosynthesis integral membrane protein MurJ [Roseimicrobium sp. ORNL1]QIF05654.1 murein biosynthesis integral membrane protein MurJ [Roseimicrobium sp. ORNL1]
MSDVTKEEPPKQEVAQASAGSEGRVNTKAFGVVTIAIFSSRILGLVREMVLAALFAGEHRKWLDCFNQAFRTPNLLRDLFAEGALSTAFVTTFSKKMKSEGDESAWQLARKMLTLAAVFMSIVSVFGILLAPFIIRLLSPGWVTETPEKIEYTVHLAQIMYPFILLVSLAALVMAMLNAKRVFGIPALSSTFFNIGSMVVGGVVGWWIDPTFGRDALIGFAVGTLAGGLLQLLVQLPSLRKVGFKFRPDFGWRDSGVSKVLSLMWPAVLSGSAVQINVMLSSIFASCLVVKDGPVTWLGQAFRLVQLPLGLFGVAVATVTVPAMSRLATEGITPAFKHMLGRALKLVFLMTLPAAVGLAILGEPIIALIFQRGRYTAEDTHMAAIALQSYSWGLVFFSSIKVIQPAFYAIDRRFVPLVMSLIAVVVSATMNTITVFWLKLGHEYLALSTSVSAFVNFSLLFYAMRQIAGGLDTRGLAVNLGKLLIAVICMGAVCWLGNKTLLDHFTEKALVLRVLYLGVTIGGAAVVYFGMNALLKNEEVAEFGAILRRKLGRK